MTEYERPSFNKEWWEKVEEFLEENPTMGFDPEDTKQFIKFCVNRKIQEAKKDIEELERLADDL